MKQTRTQIYLTREQRHALDERAAREGTTMAQVVREAIDAYLARGAARRVNAASAATFGSLPGLEPVLRQGWDRDHRWDEG